MKTQKTVINKVVYCESHLLKDFAFQNSLASDEDVLWLAQHRTAT